MRVRGLKWMGVCWLVAACSGGSGQRAPSDGGAAGVAGTGGGASGSAGSAGSGGQAAPLDAGADDCRDDGSDTADLTLAGLGISWSPPPPQQQGGSDAGASDAGASDAGSDASVPGDPAALPDVLLPGLVGWATQPGAGVPTTTGGAMGRVVTARTGEELEGFAQSEEPLVIRVCGTLRAPAVQVASNKTIVGVGRRPLLEGALRIGSAPGAQVHNVVVKNLEVDATYSEVAGAGIQIANAHHVWIDHCDLYNAIDGLVQVVRGADLVSISWTKFHFTPFTLDVEHRFACLIGHSDDDAARAEDTGHLKVTLHHNWWAEYIRQRAPRVRFGDVHLFNNYYSSIGNDYSIWAALGSRVLLESNYFHGVTNPHELHDPDAQLLSEGNIYDATVGPAQSTGSAFVPPYAFTPDPTADVPDLVRNGAGVK